MKTKYTTQIVTLDDLTIIMYQHFQENHRSNTKGCICGSYPQGYIHPQLN